MRAQPLIDLSLETADQQLEVRLLPQATFQGLVSNVQFTLRWNDAELHALSISQPPLEAQYIPMQPAGQSWSDGTFVYQTFVGFGLLPMDTVGVQWQAGQEVVLMRLQVPSLSPTYELVRAEAVQPKNGAFYVELNGQVATGQFRNIQAGGQTALGDRLGQTVSFGLIFPNPGKQTFFLPVESQSVQHIQVGLYNQNGQKVYFSDWKIHPGRHQLQLRFPTLPAGVYHLFLITQDEQMYNQNIMIF